jgi:tripartite-type tricarboxylate transporter receptor subunit TctC
MLAVAQDAPSKPVAYPTKPVTIVVPFPAGGGTDVVFRVISARLQAELGMPILIDNRAGAGGTVGTAAVAKGNADGYTLIAVTTTTIASAQAVYPKLGYDPVTSFAPISTLGSTPFVLVTAPSLPARNLAEFIAYAKANGGALNYASIGNGSASHLVAELFKQRTGVAMTHIPYRGAGPAQTDLMAGQVQVLFDNPTALVQQVRAGKMHALAITEPSNVFPELPTFEASGIPDFKPELWYGLMAAAATPPAVIQRLHDALKRVLEDSSVRADMLARGVKPLFLSPEDFGQKIRADIALWGGIARSVDAKVE